MPGVMILCPAMPFMICSYSAHSYISHSWLLCDVIENWFLIFLVYSLMGLKSGN